MSQKIQKYNITVPISTSELVVQVRGDQHYGVKGVDKDLMTKTLLEEQNQHKNNLFVIDTGDTIENHLTTSIGHGYDIEIKDPQEQIDHMREMFIDLNKHLYGEKEWENINFGNKKNLTNCLHVGVTGNHEYRTRKTAGIWPSKLIYNPSKTLDLGIDALINLKIVNKKIKKSKEYLLYIAHRPKSSNSTSIERIITTCRVKKGDIPADIYVYGHFHKRIIFPDATYDKDGNFKKVLYVVNPSPINGIEYAQWYGFSPVASSLFTNFYLPIENHKDAYGIV